MVTCPCPCLTYLLTFCGFKWSSGYSASKHSEPAPSLNQNHILSMKARMSGHQLYLSEPRPGCHGPVSTEQVKCSCGNVSSKAALSIKLNKRGSAVTTSQNHHAAEGRLLKILHFSNILFYSSLFSILSETHTHTLIYYCASD